MVELRSSLLFVVAAVAALVSAFIVPEANAMKIQAVKSPGGIEAWLVEEYTVPLIAVDCSFAGGSAQDGAGRSGLGKLLRGLLDSGAGPYSYLEFQEK